MKNPWKISIAALVLVSAGLPAFAFQGGLPAPKSPDQMKRDRKIDAAAMTPFVTKHQADVLKGDANKADERKADEQIAYPQGAGPMQPPAGAMPDQQMPGRPLDPNSHEGQPAPKAEPVRPSFRLMGTICGDGKDIAIFEVGAEWPSMLKAGDKLPDGSLIVSVERGKVMLERVVSVAQPAVEAQPAVVDQPGMPGHAEIQARVAQPEKKERFELYVW